MTDVRLRRYQIMESLGEGSQGHTFRGIDRANEQEVAIKVLSLREVGNWKAFDLFERECKVLARLDHPGIPRFIDHYASESSGDFFLVMSIAEGRSLASRQVKAESFPPPRIRAILDQALDVLAYLHSRAPAVIHRDIKPANLVLSDSGHLTLVDFGGVRAAFRPDGGSTMIGTFGYMAPEQLHGGAGPASDLFSLAATLVSLATGMPADALPRKGLRIDLDHLVPQHPLHALFADMLEPDPDERLRSVAAVRTRLAELDANGARSTKSSTASARPQARHKRPKAQATTALAKMPDEVMELARTESTFLQVLIWLFASLGSGALVLTQVLFLPLFFRIAMAIQRGERAREELADNQREAQRDLQAHRETLRFLASATHPLDGHRGQP